MGRPQPAEQPDARGTGALEPGARVGRFEIAKLLGRGSMGAVYHAVDPLIGREVAVKTLTGDFSVSAGELELLRRRFLNEARSAGALRDPGIVTIYDVIEDEDGRVSIAMEYIDGQSLRDVLDDSEPLPMKFVARAMSEVARTLDSAHARGIIHRDIKPANILLTCAGEFKIADFGIASLRGDDLASELNALGTPNYLPPERILGQAADHRGDIYALGVILYEMLTRRLPFHGRTMGELARAVVQDPPADPTTTRPDLTPAVLEVLGRALDKDPECRYQTAGELAQDLRAAVRDQAKMSDTVPTPAVEELEWVHTDGEEDTIVEKVEEPPSPDSPRSRSGSTRPMPGVGPMTLLRPMLEGARRLRAGGVAALVVFVVGALAVSMGALSGSWRPDPEARAAASRLSQFHEAVAEAKELLERGDYRSASKAIQRAAAASPTGALNPQLDELRGRVERQRRARLEAERKAEASALFEEARAAFDRRDLGGTELTLAALFELEPQHEGGLALASAVGALRTALARTRRAAVVQPVVEESPPPERSVETAAVFEDFEAAPVVARVDPFGVVRLEFLSERPKGVLTLYAGGEQVLRRPFRFFEKKGLMRRRGVSGGFDGEQRLPSGPLELRVYLTLPGRPAQSKVVEATLAAGEVVTLRIRVDQAGDLSVALR